MSRILVCVASIVVLSSLPLHPADAQEQPAPESTQRTTLAPPADLPVPSHCHADCRTARRSCRAACVDANRVEGESADIEAVELCAAPCEATARACVAACAEGT